jgi:CheY-like chemotaxis protein
MVHRQQNLPDPLAGSTALLKGEEERVLRFGVRRLKPWLGGRRLAGLFLLVLGLGLACFSQAAERASTVLQKSPLRGKAAQVQKGSRAEGSATALGSLAPGGPDLQSIAAPVRVRVQDLLLGALLLLVGLLALRQFALQIAHMFRRPTVFREAEPEADGPADDRAFGEFLVAFKAGPASKPGPQQVATRSPLCAKAHEVIDPGQDTAVDPLKPFFAQAQPKVLAMRNLFQDIRREVEEAPLQTKLEDLNIQLRTLQDAASLPQLLAVWQLASALGGLVRQLAQRVSNVTPDTLRTLGSGLDLLSDLCQPGIEAGLAIGLTIRLLAVDDDPISRHAVGMALKKAFNQPDIAANGEAALAQASMIAYDVIFLDVLMPGMDGFELCSRIRQTSLNRNTPVVFVTSEDGFDAHANSHLSGGNDFITKPFLTFNLTAKALVLALRAKLEKQSSTSADSSVATPVLPVAAS